MSYNTSFWMLVNDHLEEIVERYEDEIRAELAEKDKKKGAKK